MISKDTYLHRDLYDELELMQYLSCETFLNAQEELPLCESLGINCPEDYDGCATEPLDAKEVLSVLEWTDTSTLTSIDDVAYRNESLRYMFADHGDIRGAFASVYSPITDAAVDAIDAGEFVNDVGARTGDDFAGYYDVFVHRCSPVHNTVLGPVLQADDIAMWLGCESPCLASRCT